MNSNKVAFIIAVNDENAFNECSFYIKNLNREDFEIEIIPRRNSESIAMAYNEAMNNSDAKYKVYLHQDVFIINKNFIQEIVNLFSSNDEIGLIGVCGCNPMPESGVWWESSKRFGKVYDSCTGILKLLSFDDIEEKYQEAESVDGLILITQYDIKWREDLFKGWHFYDASQCMEFIRAGYKVVVPKQISPWCTHDCGIVNIANGYEENRQVYINEYKK